MIQGTRLLILGRQGAGKGTQCVRLSNHYVVPHISTGDMFRAALEGVAQATRHIIETYGKAGVPPREVFAVGGGTKSKLWSQAISESCNITQQLREKSWGASFGDAFLAALAVGDAKPDDMAQWNPVIAEITPDPGNRETYDKLYARFRGLYEASKPWR